MIKLEDIQPSSMILGILPNHPVRIVGVDFKNDSLVVYYQDHQGKLSERELYRSDEPKLSLASAHKIWSFDGSAEDFKLATEAYRIKLAHLFDPMMAVHIANIDPLPHQIAAVYESMLPFSPLRFLLADDPGAGKTVMAGLYIQELILRADAQRILIICPGGLSTQWQEELKKKFNLEFDIFAPHMLSRPFGNPFERYPLLIVGIDQISRFEERCDLLKATNYDLAVIDEAHKLSARWEGSECKKTKRFKLGEILRSNARHFLLMTATPHNGKEEDFQLFLSLLDEDSFYSKYRRNLSRTDQTDLKNFMRRMIKEELVTFDGRPLFPLRIAETVSYKLSDREKDLYEKVTEYVRVQMNNAELLERNALAEEIIDTSRLLRIKEDFDKAEARKLQPHFIKAFFLEAFKCLGGQIISREQERFEVLSVPLNVLEKAKTLPYSPGTESNCVSHRYERICFDKKYIGGKSPQAQLIHAAHPLLRASLELILSEKRAVLQQGTVLVNSSDWSTEPKNLLLIEHTIVRQSSEKIVSKRLQFLYLDTTGALQHAGYAPHLDLEPIKQEDLPFIEKQIQSPLFSEKEVLAFASESIAKPHLDEILCRIEKKIEKSRELIHKRLQQNIDACQQKRENIQEELDRDRGYGDVKLDKLHKRLERIDKDLDDLSQRRSRRLAELEEEKNIASTPPKIIGAALVIPAGLIASRKGEVVTDQTSNAEIEKIAMQAVIEAENAMGHEVFDVSDQNCGWDITSIPPSVDGKPAEARHIEVKGRTRDADTITVTKNEYLAGLNQGTKFLLALVLIAENSQNIAENSQNIAENSQKKEKGVQGPYYVKAPFNGELQWDAVSVNLDIKKLIARAEIPTHCEASAG